MCSDLSLDLTKESTVSLCTSLCDDLSRDILHSNALRDQAAYSVDVGVQADR